MKKMNSLTRNFINDNIKTNSAVSSYPLRSVLPKSSALKDNTADSDDDHNHNNETKVLKNTGKSI